MFGFFINKEPQCPVSLAERLYLENSFLWLATQFGHEEIRNKMMFFPTVDHFSLKFNGSKESVYKAASIIASRMDIDINEIQLETFKESIHEVQNELGNRIFTQLDTTDSEESMAGCYFDKNEAGKYEIFIEESHLKNAENLVAILAHEFSHIKILGEKRLDFNDEALTDLTTIIFGFGIFNANASFQTIKTFDMWGHSSLGYLKQQEWGYALALYAFFRQDDRPSWLKHLNKNIRSDFEKSMRYMLANTDKIFWQDNDGNMLDIDGNIINESAH
jgi:hypothetical protein